jgi:hypothetical protein
MPRGGKRSGAGRRSSWASGCGREDTKLIRVPIALADRLVEIAHLLDSGHELQVISPVAESDVDPCVEFSKAVELSLSVVEQLKLADSPTTSPKFRDLTDDGVPLTLRDAADLVGCASSTLQDWKSKLTPDQLAAKTLEKSAGRVALIFRELTPKEKQSRSHQDQAPKYFRLKNV